MKDQQEAEKKKVASQEISEQLAVQTKGIKEKKAMVLVDLAKVEPAVQDAQQGSCGPVGVVSCGGLVVTPPPSLSCQVYQEAAAGGGAFHGQPSEDG